MIAYIELLNKYTLKPYAPVEPSECWFELSYYDVGECEIYCIASKRNLAALKKGAYVKIPNKRFIWFITSITYTYNASGARMILAKGKEAKAVLDKRIIKEPLELPLNLQTAVLNLVTNNLGIDAAANRKIDKFFTATNLNARNITIQATQATRTNLLEFTNNLLKTYACGANVYTEYGYLYYSLLVGQDKTASVVFSQSNDNLLSSEYYSSDENLRTYAEVVSKFTEKDANDNSIDIYYTSYKDLGQTGIDRSELLISSDISTSYNDTNGQEQTAEPTSALYQSWQIDEGTKALTEHKTEETAKGEIDLEHSRYVFDDDFFLGDIIKIKDEYFNYSFNARVTKITFTQNAEGYGEELEYGEEIA